MLKIVDTGHYFKILEKNIKYKMKFKHFFQVFVLGCSGPLANARTIPKWLKNNYKNKSLKDVNSIDKPLHFISFKD